ncbi:ORF069 [Staphylococcus phage EW]|uniref:ORF069 n=1 Tax=Staphylococcus phage EW TaxID=2936814 RepID=Q4ZC08_9CAUD|nr:ORF069 [Staphylococcus phage EW]AAX91392.1 ORF069 [Staphylococcus phage EW]
MNSLVNLGERIIQLEKERDTLIADITRLRAERDEYKRKLDDVVELFTRHINYKLSVSHNTWYLSLRHKLDEVLKDDNQS